MKATSIEQIREHLARGGRVYAVLHDASVERVDKVEDERIYAGIWSSDFACLDINYWMLLPIEKPEKRPEWFRDSQKERMQRIRQSLLFGHYPAMNDLRDWWQATTGERIQRGRRCNYCECAGRVNYTTIHEVDCPKCNGSGYTVRPTWMGEEATGDE